MPHKQVLFRSATREKVLCGATQLTDAVRVTLGPRSKAVLIERKWGAPLVCNDGVTIAREFDLKDPEENLGPRMSRQAADKTGDMVGDGASTATILAHAIFADGVRNVVAGASGIDIKRGLDRAAQRAIDTLRTISRPVRTRKEKAQVAAISTHNDEAIGELVAKAMDKVGGEGVITVEESKTSEFVALGQTIKLAAVKAPTYMLAARDDELVAPGQLDSTSNPIGAARGEIVMETAPGNHLSLCMGEKTLARP